MTKHSLNRREFLRQLSAVGGAAALAAFLESCSPAAAFPIEPTLTGIPESQVPSMEILPTKTAAPESIQPTSTASEPAPAPTETVPDGKARVAFIKTTDRAEGVRRAVELLGVGAFTGQSVFLKPNFNSYDPAPGSTHPDVLRSMVTVLQEGGARRIVVGDRSGMGDTRKVMQRLGVFKLAEEMGFEVVVFDELGAEDWVLFQPENSHWQNGFHLARPCLEADAVVQLCCLKTHRFGGHFTLSLKNSVGMAAKRLPGGDYNFMTELHDSDHQRRMIAEINAAYTPALVVMDGVEAFISGGPDQGKLVKPGVVLAGTDRIALDAAGVALLRLHGCKTEAGKGKIFEQEQIVRAVELGLGVDGPEKIEFLTADADSAAYSSQIQSILAEG